MPAYSFIASFEVQLPFYFDWLQEVILSRWVSSRERGDQDEL